MCSFVLNERDLLRVAVFVVALPLLVAVFISATPACGSSPRARAARRGCRSAATARCRSTLQRTGRLPDRRPPAARTACPYALGARPRFVVERLPRHDRRAAALPAAAGAARRPAGGPAARDASPTRSGWPSSTASWPATPGWSSCRACYPLTGLPERRRARRRARTARSGCTPGRARTTPSCASTGRATTCARCTGARPPAATRSWCGVEERPWRGGTTVLLDHRAAAHRGTGPAASLEWAVSFAASACLHLHRPGTASGWSPSTACALAGEVRRRRAQRRTWCSTRWPRCSRRTSATSRCGGDPARRPGADRGARRGQPGGRRRADPATGRAPRAASPSCSTRRRGRRAARPQRRATERLGGRCCARPGWGVVIAEPDTPMGAVWSELCRARHPRRHAHASAMEAVSHDDGRRADRRGPPTGGP